MPDLFLNKNIKPMLIKDRTDPYNSAEWIYELKLDGIRCIAYLDKDNTELRTRTNRTITMKFPELSDIHKQVMDKCILDGELIIMKDGVPDFHEVQRRNMLSDHFKIQLASSQFPACLVVYDILYYIDKDLTDNPLLFRKNILESCIIENPRIAVSRFIEENGIELFHAAELKKLEGVVAKKKESLYWQDKRTREWVKFKRLEDDEFVICGYVRKKPMNVLLLGQYDGDKLVYKGSVSFGVRLDYLISQYNLRPISHSPFRADTADGPAIWLLPNTVCTVEYMPGTRDYMRQSVFKGIRDDVLPEECKIK